MTKKMVLILSLLLGMTSALCAGDGFNLDQAKKRAKEHLDKEIKVLESAKECVDKASNKNEFDACKAKAKIDLQAAKKSK